MKKLFIVLIVLGAFLTISFAQEKTSEELAKLSQNPLANLMSFPIQNNSTFGIGEFDRTSNVTNFQPVLPFFNGQLITRTIIPFVSNPIGESESLSGVGDINFSAFYSPLSNGSLVWGVGSIAVIPINNDVSSKKWSLGPSVVVLKITKTWVYGFVWNNIWSVAGDENAKDVSSMLLQYFINYNLKDGWYLSSAPIVTANWEATDGNQWVIPFGGGAGKIVRFGKLPVNIQAQVFYNVVKPDNYGDWSLRLQAQLMLPK